MRALAAALLAALVAWAIAQLALDHYLRDQGLHELARVQRGESRIGFEFAHSRDLISGGAEGLGDLAWVDGVLRGQLTGPGVNLRLNLRGLHLDATRFDRLHAVVEVSAPATLTLIFDEPGQLLQLKRDIPLATGWNELAIDLADAAWTANDGGTSASRWGGASGRVGEFRLYLAGPPGLRLGLDHVRFLAREQAQTDTPIAIEWIEAGRVRDRIAAALPLRQHDQSRLGVLLDIGRDTPERSLALRDQIRAVDAEALFWPAGRELPAKLPQAHPAPSGWSPGWAGVAAYALLALLLRWRGPRRGARRAAAIELVVGYMPLLALSLGLGLGEQPMPTTLAWISAALAFQLTGVRRDGGLATGAAPAWAASLKFTLIGACGLGAVAWLTGHWQLPGGQRVALYVPFVALQQAVLLGFLWPRLRDLAPKHALWMTAALFALAHAPNFALMLLSMLGAWWWLTLYRRHRAWLPILASHYLLGLLAISGLPPAILYSAEVGLRYFQVQ
jgi:hypothetical protein